VNVKFPTLSDKQKGSVSGLVEYLEKEDLNRRKQNLPTEAFFSHSRDQVPASEVTKSIDSNIRKLGKEDYKFYTIVLSPSSKELEHIGQDSGKLKAYTRKMMEDYAKNFGKGLQAKDLVYFAKVEHHRHDRQTKQDKGEGNQHVHVIVSRRDQGQRYKLSPYSNAKSEYETTNKIKSSGFDRNWFREQSEQVFDQQFGYTRDPIDTFLYQNTMKNGSYEQKKAVLAMAQQSRKGRAEKASKLVETVEQQKNETIQKKQQEQTPSPGKDSRQNQGVRVGQ
jgi:hypothetical protein